MSSIMRSRSALPGRCEGSEVIAGSSLELKVAGPSMLGIGCPDRHALPLTPRRKSTHRAAYPSRESGFVLGWIPALPGLMSQRRGSAESGRHDIGREGGIHSL